MPVLRRPPSRSEEGPTSSWNRSPAGLTLGVYLCVCVGGGGGGREGS